MSSKSPILSYLATLALIAVVQLLIVSGYALDKNGNGPTAIGIRIGGHSGLTVEPKRCLLKVAIVARPFGDPVINDVVWRVADEQIIPPIQRRSWEVNGLRIGRISGDLPLELEAALTEKRLRNELTRRLFSSTIASQRLLLWGHPLKRLVCF